MLTVSVRSLKPAPAGPPNDRDRKLLAYISLLLGGSLVVRDCRLIAVCRPDGGVSRTFLDLPSRPFKAHCGVCDCRVSIVARYCEHCGAAQPPRPGVVGPSGVPGYYTSVVSPVDAEGRGVIEEAVLRAYCRARGTVARREEVAHA